MAGEDRLSDETRDGSRNHSPSVTRAILAIYAHTNLDATRDGLKRLDDYLD